MNAKIPDSITKNKPGFLQDLLLNAKLIMRLMGDRRVPILLKAMPVGALVYWIVPDLVPGPIDDALVMWIGVSLFVELCPPEVVAEHRKALLQMRSGVTEVPPEEKADDDANKDVVDGEFHDL